MVVKVSKLNIGSMQVGREGLSFHSSTPSWVWREGERGTEGKVEVRGRVRGRRE